MWQYVALILGLLMSLPAPAQWQGRDGKAAEDAPDRQHDGDLAAMLALSSEPDAFLKEWYGTPYDAVPKLTTAHEAHRGDHLGVFVIFGGCAPKDAECDAEVDFKVLRPDGSTYGEIAHNKVWAAAAPGVGTLLLSKARMLIRVEPSDPLGEYIVRALFRAPGHRDLTLESKFSVAP